MAGAFVVLVGPDGVGKTSVAKAIADSFDGPTAYFHFRPPLRGEMLARPPEEMSPAVDKSPPPGPVVLGWLRLLKHVVQSWLGHISTVRPAIRRGTLVMGDRWSYGYVVQPLALRFYGPPWMARQAMRLLPRPDLVANLVAPTPVIRRRKQELSEDEIEAELKAWADLRAPNFTHFDANHEPDQIASAILDEIR